LTLAVKQDAGCGADGDGLGSGAGAQAFVTGGERSAGKVSSVDVRWEAVRSKRVRAGVVTPATSVGRPIACPAEGVSSTWVGPSGRGEGSDLMDVEQWEFAQEPDPDAHPSGSAVGWADSRRRSWVVEQAGVADLLHGEHALSQGW
jgi:hypothetical protein